MPTQWEHLYPNLGSWEKTSDETDAYNCTAFAASDDTRWWDPIAGDIYYWPDGVPRSWRMPHLIINPRHKILLL